MPRRLPLPCPPSAPRRAAGRLTLALTLAGLGLLGPPSPAAAGGDTGGPAPLDLHSAAACAGCHAEEHAAWAASQHATAWSDPRFQVSWRAWPKGWCLECHLPDPPQQAELSPAGLQLHRGDTLRGASAGGPRAAEGVGCAACHLRGDTLISRARPSRQARAAHPIEADPRLGAPEDCGRCHDFPFQDHSPPEGAPAGAFTLSEEPLQDTLDEWRSSEAAAAGRGCVDCHMADAGHTFPGGHDTRLLQGALAVEVQALAPLEVEVRLRARGVGHRAPTGDPFRRLMVLLCADLDCAEVVGEAVFRRTFTPTETSWTLDQDTTVPPAAPGQPAERRLRVTVSAPAVAWALDLAWVDRASEAALPAEAARTRISAGRIQPAP